MIIISDINAIIEDIGEDVTLRKISKSDPNKWGDSTESAIIKTVKGHFQILSNEDDEVREGSFKTGDLQAFFKPTETNINRGNQIVYKGQDYEIVEVINEPDIAGESHIMAIAKVI